MAQNHPDLFAGIASFEGTTYFKNIKNNGNLKIINVFSDMNKLSKNFYKKQSRLLNEYRNITTVFVEKLNHTQIAKMLNKREILETFLSFKKEEYPVEVNYRTENNRWLKSYWIELHGIAFGKKYTQIRASFTNNTIKIVLTNSIGVTITLPPAINKSDFKIIVNNSTEFNFKNYEQEKVHIVKNKNKFTIADN